MILIELAVIGIYIGLFLFCVLFSLEVDKMTFKDNKTYDVIKYIALIGLPALGTLYFALASIWKLPYGQEVVGTITAIDTFLGALIGISAHNYSKEDQE